MTLRSFNLTEGSPLPRKTTFVSAQPFPRRNKSPWVLGDLHQATTDQFRIETTSGGAIAIPTSNEALGLFKGLQRSANLYAERKLKSVVGVPRELCVDGRLGPFSVSLVRAIVKQENAAGSKAATPPANTAELATNAETYAQFIKSFVDSIAPNFDPRIMTGDRDACGEPGEVIAPAPVKKKRTGLLAAGLLLATMGFFVSEREDELGDCGCGG